MDGNPPPEGTLVPADASLAEVEIVRLSATRKAIARRLTTAWEAPAFQLVRAVDTARILELRRSLVATTVETDVAPTLSDVLLRLVGTALTRHPAVNATLVEDAIHRHPSADIGIAVATAGGLVVPVIRHVERSSIREIARARAELVERARARQHAPADMQGGTFTVSNLGMFGVEQFVAVLNPPQVAILAVGAVKDEAIVLDGAISVAPIMRITLTCDHRAVDGADGAAFLQTLSALIEHPGLAA
jgi:pyruvate dehydrogenase E2 component (dihydrolipoamide acetyltransferase)